MSYSDIRKKLGLKSKGTLSKWFRNITLSKQSLELLERNNVLAHKRGLLRANKERTARISEENQEAFLSGKKMVRAISNYELLLLGAALYWGEGTKSERGDSTPLSFSNSDPLMISIYMRFLREVLRVPEEKIRAGIHIYESISAAEARKFWSRQTGLPEKRFYIITQVSQASRNKRPFNSLPYGTAVIKVSNRVQFHKVKGMIRGIVEKAGSRRGGRVVERA